MTSKYIGDNLLQKNVSGDFLRRTYLDSAATSLPSVHVQNTLNAFLPNYGSFHSEGHFSATVSMEAFLWSKQRILTYLQADASEYDVVFIGAGATAAINRVAAGLAAIRGGRDIALVSLMEHHSNDLPHRQHSPRVIHLPIDETSDWKVDMDGLRNTLTLHSGHVNYIAVTAASNVTGLLNPISDIARLAHAYGVKVLVDGAQIYAHHPISLASTKGEGVDFFVFSGHKAHAPYAPGVLVARKKLLVKMPPLFFGGGMVGEVSKFDFSVASGNAQKEHAGTPSILGAFSLGLATDFLAHEGIAQLSHEEQRLKQRLIKQATANENIRLYGSPKTGDGSLGIVCFNLKGIPHNLLGAMLNDYFCIAVRSGCFCAHPYVRQLLFDDFLLLGDDADTEDHKGMVRISLGPHNTTDDIDFLLLALNEIGENFQAMAKPYQRMPDGGFRFVGNVNYSHEYFEAFMRQTALTTRYFADQ